MYSQRNQHSDRIVITALIMVFQVMLLAIGGSGPAQAEPNLTERSWNAPFKTVGGTQLWADGYLHAGWRIQRNVMTGHSRLLDPRNVRHAWGSFDHCKKVFDQIRKRRPVVPSSGHLVLLVHGIAPRPGTFAAMEAALDDAGYDATPISYPSTRAAIEVHAEGLEQLLNRIEGTQKVSFVTHSMGGLVVRHLLHRNGAWKARIEVGRIVQIAPPHLGSEAAEWAADLKPYQWILGNAGVQLTPGRVAKIPSMTHAFAIIAGGKGDGDGFNPLLPGDDDGVVTVAETRLPGAADFLVVDATHTALARKPETIHATLNYLNHGTFANSSENR